MSLHESEKNAALLKKMRKEKDLKIVWQEEEKTLDQNKMEQEIFKKWSASGESLLSRFETAEFMEKRKMSEEWNGKNLEMEFSEQQQMMVKLTKKKSEEKLEEEMSRKLQEKR